MNMRQINVSNLNKGDIEARYRSVLGPWVTQRPGRGQYWDNGPGGGQY